MSNLLRAICIPFLGLCAALPAQGEGDKAKPADAPKAQSQAPAKDDATTAKDPAIVAIDKFIADKKVDKKGKGWRLSLSEPPKQTFDPASQYFLHFETAVGPVKILLWPAEAPMHVTCGIYLARLGFYDDLNFHRIIPGFMAQGGCPQGNGSGGPGYTIDGEYQSGRKHDKPGLLSTANTGQPKTDGSQFFLTFVPTPWLDGKHTIWGEVVDGMETLKALEKLGNAGGRVANPPKIQRAWVTVVGKAKADKADKADKSEKGEKADKGGER